MAAAVFRSFGPPSVLKYETDFPKPNRRKGEVLVKVAAASVNPIDWKTRKGEVPRMAVTRPKIPGGDVAGVVQEADQDSPFKPGDKVFGCTGHQIFWSTYGTYAEYVVTHQSTLQHIPDNTSFQEAAAVPLAAMTAWQAVESSMPLTGKRVLVHAGAGGVGSFAVQIAKAQGAYVATTCSARNADFVTKTLGADRAIDYNKEKFEETSEPYDVVVDLIGGSYELRSMKCLKPRGHFAHVINSGFMHQYGPLRGVPALMYYMGKHSLMGALGWGPRYTVTVMNHQADRGLKQLSELMKEGKLKVTIEKVFPLSQADKAHELSEGGHVRGKVVLQVADL
jgi:NADPH:quinone reductase-like Zn-dependent oxidoreductase